MKYKNEVERKREEQRLLDLFEQGKLHFWRGAKESGYVSRKTEPTPELYDGRHGHGVKVVYPSYGMTSAHWIEYWFEVDKDENVQGE